jgi:5-methylcytosine-specific restriction endonuclease McrA
MKILVLNADYMPVNVTTLKRGFKLVYKGKAEVIKHIEGQPIITSTKTIARPSVIRLLKYVYLPFKKVQLTRLNLYKRDGFKCGYCGSYGDLTIDHILPKSRGGQNSWENLITCCHKCNVKKGDRMPEEVGFVLSHKPFKPDYLFFIDKISRPGYGWDDFLFKK